MKEGSVQRELWVGEDAGRNGGRNGQQSRCRSTATAVIVSLPILTAVDVFVEKRYLHMTRTYRSLFRPTKGRDLTGGT